MEFEFVQCEMRGETALLTIARPAVLNALSSRVLDELDARCGELAAKGNLGALIITGAGEKAFVAGADIGEMAGMSKAAALEFARKGQRVFARLEALPFPVIAAVNGFALGGGCELAMACDIRVASSNAKFGQPEVALGLIPGYAGTQRLARLVGRGDALYLLMSGETISAEEALRIGLVQKVTAPSDLMQTCLDMAARIAGKGPVAVKTVKAVTRRGVEMHFDEACRLEAESFSGLFGEAEAIEGMTAFLEKRKASFTR